MQVMRTVLTSGAALLAVATFSGSATAAEEEACKSTGAKFCGVVVEVADPDRPCVRRDGKVYCPVYNVYRTVVILV